MSIPYNQKSALSQMLIDAFSSYAEKNTALTAMILEKMLFPESDDAQETDDKESDGFSDRLKKVVHLIMVLPEKTASEIMGSFRCLSDEEDLDFFDMFIFEMARIDNFNPCLFSDALGGFSSLESAEPFGGIDRTRIIGENAFGTKRMIDCINRLTENLLASSEKPDDESGTH